MSEYIDSVGRLGFFNPYATFIRTGAFLKAAENALELGPRSIKIRDHAGVTIGFLVPISKVDLADDQSVQSLTTWRSAHQYAYPTRFTVTNEGTEKWLRSAVLDNSDRILFWVTDLKFRPIGHLGLLAIAGGEGFEVDNVLRGLPGAPGIMAAAMGSVEAFFEEECSIEKFSLRVLESNAHAVKFYEKLDYKVSDKQSLNLVKDESGEKLVAGPNGDDYFLTMQKDILHARSVPELVLTAGPSIGMQELAYTSDAARTGWNANHSDYLSRFEADFADYVGARFAMATSSCTGALHLSLLALGIGPGDEVIVPEITWVATASAVRYVGATPVFCDVDRSSWTMSLESLRACISNKTKAIMPVHLYGFAADMEGVSKVAAEFNLKVVEDAAPAIGTTLNGRSAGTFGDFGCYSFQGAKMLVTGEGGMLVSDDEELFAKARKIQDHGRRPGTFWIDEVGYKYKMSNLTAALGLGQLHRSEQQIARKTRIRSWYEDELSSIEGLSFQESIRGSRSIHWMTSITIPETSSLSRDEVIARLRTEGIDSRPVFPAISQYPIWPETSEPGVVAKFVGDNSINLPSGVKLSRASVAKIGEVLRGLFS